MFEAIKQNADKADYIIMAAAVSDYRLENIAEHKIKKSDDTIEMTFVKNPDILPNLGQLQDKKTNHLRICNGKHRILIKMPKKN